eukprot:2948230-Alexandrium_andersonii.AAC.1
MSASLVGSEMCIRDSSKTQQDKARQSKTQQDKARQSKTKQDKARQTVSYTHLTLPTICSV